MSADPCSKYQTPIPFELVCPSVSDTDRVFLSEEGTFTNRAEDARELTDSAMWEIFKESFVHRYPVKDPERFWNEVASVALLDEIIALSDETRQDNITVNDSNFKSSVPLTVKIFRAFTFEAEREFSQERYVQSLLENSARGRMRFTPPPETTTLPHVLPEAQSTPLSSKALERSPVPSHIPLIPQTVGKLREVPEIDEIESRIPPNLRLLDWEKYLNDEGLLAAFDQAVQCFRVKKRKEGSCSCWGNRDSEDRLAWTDFKRELKKSFSDLDVERIIRDFGEEKLFLTPDLFNDIVKRAIQMTLSNEKNKTGGCGSRPDMNAV